MQNIGAYGVEKSKKDVIDSLFRKHSTLKLVRKNLSKWKSV